MTGTEAGNLSLAPRQAYAQLVGHAAAEAPLRRVEKGSPARSYLMHKLRGTHASVKGQGVRMPIGAPLDEASMSKIGAWIERGAPNN